MAAQPGSPGRRSRRPFSERALPPLPALRLGTARRRKHGRRDPREYHSFLSGGWAETVFVEFHHGARLIAVAVLDRLPRAHSAVYTFYDPAFESRSLGTYCILWQIEAARRAGHEWLYLGYWIAECAKMRYKERFLPQERLIHGDWVRCGSLPEQLC